MPRLGERAVGDCECRFLFELALLPDLSNSMSMAPLRIGEVNEEEMEGDSFRGMALVCSDLVLPIRAPSRLPLDMEGEGFVDDSSL